jgi:hypothetical protein
MRMYSQFEHLDPLKGQLPWAPFHEAQNALGRLTLPLFRVVLSPTVTRPFCAVPRTSVARTASG